MVRRATNIANALNIPMQAAMAALVANGDEAQSMLDRVQEKLDGFEGSTAPAGYVARFEAAKDALVKTNDEFDTMLGKTQDVRQALEYLPGGVTDALTQASELGVTLDRLANPRSVTLNVEANTGPAEIAIERLRQRASRDLSAQFYVTQNGRVIT
jgi:hypothetical protein